MSSTARSSSSISSFQFAHFVRPGPGVTEGRPPTDPALWQSDTRQQSKQRILIKATVI